MLKLQHPQRRFLDHVGVLKEKDPCIMPCIDAHLDVVWILTFADPARLQFADIHHTQGSIQDDK